MYNKRFYGNIIGVSALLVILIAIQSLWLYNAAEIDKRDSEKKVIRALRSVEDDLRTMSHDLFASGKSYLAANEGVYLVKQKCNSNGFYGAADTLNLFLKGGQNQHMESVIASPAIVSARPAIMDVQLKFNTGIKDTTLFLKEKNEFDQEIESRSCINTDYDKTPAAQMFNMKIIDSLIRLHLSRGHIDAHYGYGIISNDENKIVLGNRVADSALLLHSPYSILLFEDDIFTRPYKLSVVFRHGPGISALTSWLALSVLVVILLCLFFLSFTRFHLRQARLAEMKSEFINNLTHEFNTPMANIALAVETLRRSDEPINPVADRILTIISSESSRLSENIERSLLVAKMEKEKLQLYNEDIDLVIMINTILSACQLQCEKLNGQIVFSHPGSVPYYGDETHLLNSICNILDNAIKYRKEKPDIIITLQQTENAVIITVEDKGIGMSVEEQKRIFEKFYRAQQGYTHDTKGFGLGLSYVHGIVGLHGGKIEVWSRKGIGSRFIITLLKPGRHERKS